MALSSAATIAAQPGPQTEFLRSPADICIYGGAAGGGKTVGLILEPLRYATRVVNFTAVFFRRSTPQITNPGGLWQYGRICVHTTRRCWKTRRSSTKHACGSTPRKFSSPSPTQRKQPASPARWSTSFIAETDSKLHKGRFSEAFVDGGQVWRLKMCWFTLTRVRRASAALGLCHNQTVKPQSACSHSLLGAQ